MNEGTSLSKEALNQILKITDERPDGPTLEDIQVQLRTASLGSLFTLSLKAELSEVRGEAAKIMNARLREDDHGVAEATEIDAVSQGELPPTLATHRHFYKFPEADRWVLTTRSGVRVGTFPSEEELDQWWLGLKRQRGRILTRRKKTSSP